MTFVNFISFAFPAGPAASPAKTPPAAVVMRVVVLFKIVPELNDLAEEDWSADASSGRLSPVERYARTVFNPEDESALELALRLRDAWRAGASSGGAPSGPAEVSLRAVTLSESLARRRLETLGALGFDEVVSLSPPGPETDPRFSPETTSRLLAAEIPLEGPTLVLTGCRSADGCNGLTPMLLAERLGWPLVTEVLSVAPAPPPDKAGRSPDKTPGLSVESLSDDGLVRQLVSPPIVLAVGSAPVPCLRAPTLRDRLKAGGGPVRQKNAPVDLDGRRTDAAPRVSYVLKNLLRETKSRPTTVVSGGSALEKAAVVLARLRERG